MIQETTYTYPVTSKLTVSFAVTYRGPDSVRVVEREQIENEDGTWTIRSRFVTIDEETFARRMIEGFGSYMGGWFTTRHTE